MNTPNSHLLKFPLANWQAKILSFVMAVTQDKFLPLGGTLTLNFTPALLYPYIGTILVFEEVSSIKIITFFRFISFRSYKHLYYL